MAESITSRLSSVRVINGSSIGTLLSISNKNFNNIKTSLQDFLSYIGYDETANSISVAYLYSENLTLTKKLEFIVSGETVFSIDALGRVRGKYITVSDIIEGKRLRLLKYPSYPEVGMDGEVIYTGGDFLGYINGIGWVSLLAGGGSPGGGGGISVYYFRGIMQGIVTTDSGIDTGQDNCNYLIDWRDTATGAFAGYEGYMATYDAGWEFSAPLPGFAVAVVDEMNSIYVCQDDGPISWDIAGYFYQEVDAGVSYVYHRLPTGETAILSTSIP